MANLSQKKREEMLRFLETLKEQHSDDESLMAINQIEKELTAKKYGLVWEEHEERIDDVMNTKIPVFTEISDKELNNGEDMRYNFLLEGDNLHSLRLLEKTHKGKIDIVYIDPPYNTGKKDFIYGDKRVEGDDSFRHSKWLSFMYHRLMSVKRLLAKDGFIFISIDDNELCQLRLLCDEIFGDENFISILSIENNPKGRKNSNFISVSNEYCLIYGKNKEISYFLENIPKSVSDVVQDENGNYVHNSGKRVLVGENSFNGYVLDFESDKHYSVYYNSELKDIVIRKEKAIDEYDCELLEKGYVRYISYNNNRFVLNTYSVKRFMQLYSNGALDFKNGKIYEKNFNTSIRMKSMVVNRDYRGIVNNKETDVKIDVKTTSAGSAMKELFNVKDVPFSNPKNVGLIKLLLSLIDKKDCIVLDFFAGSGTTGQAVLELNQYDGGKRQFILCTNNEIDDTIIKQHALKCGFIEKAREFKEFLGTPKYLELLEMEELKKNGICQKVTYPRLRTYITGMRADGSKYSSGVVANLKYYKTDFIPKDSEELYDDLLDHIIEMIQLQYGVKVDNEKYVIIMDDDEMDEFEKNFQHYTELKSLFINQDVLLTTAQEKLLSNVNTYIIPDCYFDFELREAGELW